MRADELTVGEDFAFPGRWFAQPLKATVLEKASEGLVKLSITHPDLGAEVRTVATKDVANGWYSEPDVERFAPAMPTLHARIIEARESGNPLTWARLAEHAYDGVRRSRALADRLTKLGIPRDHEHYAGRGGDDSMEAKVRLVLSHDELEQLLGLAEIHHTYSPDPTATHRTVETT